MLRNKARHNHNQTQKLWANILGWYGVCVILLAYTLGVFEIISVHDPLYLILNLTGAVALCVESYYKKDYQPATLNFVWGAIALISLIRII